MSANPFDDVRLPEDVEVGAHTKYNFQTTVTVLGNGDEQRNADWSEMKCEFDFGYGTQEAVDFFYIQKFFFARRGRWRSFRAKDWADYQLEQEVIGVGNGVATVFQIVKTYETGGPFPYVRRITRPIQSTVKVYIDGILQVLTTNYTLGTGANSGLITFTAPVTNTKVVTVTCEYDVPVHFNTDTFDLSFDGYVSGTVQSLIAEEDRE